LKGGLRNIACVFSLYSDNGYKTWKVKNYEMLTLVHDKWLLPATFFHWPKIFVPRCLVYISKCLLYSSPIVNHLTSHGMSSVKCLDVVTVFLSGSRTSLLGLKLRWLTSRRTHTATCSWSPRAAQTIFEQGHDRNVVQFNSMIRILS
jgi:hypothetical protein